MIAWRCALLLLCAVPVACSASADAGDVAAEEAPVTAGRATRAASYVDLGRVANGAAVTFDVPPGALGFNLVVENEAATPGSPSIVAIYDLWSPAGERVVAEGGLVGGSAGGMYRSDRVSLQVPSSDLSLQAPVAGLWTAVLVGYDAQGLASPSIELRAKLVVQSTSDGAFHGGRLDLHVYVPEGLKVQDPAVEHVVTAAAAPGDACIKARIDGFYDRLESMVGIERGEVVYHPVPASYATLIGDAQLRAYFAESKVVADAPALHVMLTNVIALQPGSQTSDTWGVAAAVGGSAGRSGTGLSGVALGISPMFSAAGDALTLLHEAGHFMGLSHTTEMIPGYFDPLSDTPQCVNVTHQNFRECPDGRDLMFALYYGASNGGQGVYLSPSQRRVLHGAPVYRPYAGPAATEP